MNKEASYSAFNFSIEIDGLACAGFSECTGLGTTTDSLRIKEDGNNRSVQKLAGIVKFNCITLRRGISGDDDFIEWVYGDAHSGPKRRDIVIVLNSESGQRVGKWQIYRCWVTKITGPRLNETEKTTAFEALEMAHEGIEWMDLK